MTPGKRRVLATSATFFALMLTACAAPLPGDLPTEQTSWSADQLVELSKQEADAGHDGQAERLEDGKVTFDEYQAAFNDLSACLNDAGIAVSEPVISPVSNDRYEFTMDVGTLDMNVGAKLSDECAAEHWTSVSQGYMFTKTPVMDVGVRDATVPCLEEDGLKPTGEETNAFEFVSLPDADPDKVTECIMLAVEDVYPGLPSVTVAF